MKHRTPKETPELDLEQQKQTIAYQLWEDEGRPDGKAEEHWTQACLVVMSLTDDENSASPVWLKRNDEVVPEQLPTIENLNKRAASRHAA